MSVRGWRGGEVSSSTVRGVAYYRFRKTVGRLSRCLTATSAAHEGVEWDSEVAEVIWERGEVEVVMR